MKTLFFLLIINLLLIAGLAATPWRDEPPPSGSPIRQPGPAAAVEASSPVTQSVVWSRLFVRAPAPRPQPAPVATGPAEPAIQVTGILFDGTEWQVIGRRPDGRPIALRRGEIFDGWRLSMVERSKADFERGGIIWSASIEPKP